MASRVNQGSLHHENRDFFGRSEVKTGISMPMPNIEDWFLWTLRRPRVGSGSRFDVVFGHSRPPEKGPKSENCGAPNNAEVCQHENAPLDFAPDLCLLCPGCTPFVNVTAASGIVVPSITGDNF